MKRLILVLTSSKNRISGGLQNLSQKKKGAVASELERRSWTSKELRTLFNDSTVLRKSKLTGEALKIILNLF